MVAVEEPDGMAVEEPEGMALAEVADAPGISWGVGKESYGTVHGSWIRFGRDSFLNPIFWLGGSGGRRARRKA